MEQLLYGMAKIKNKLIQDKKIKLLILCFKIKIKLL